MPLRPDLPPGSTDYDISVDLTNFSADKMLFGQKVEAQTLRVTATNQLDEIKGDVKIAGAPAQIDYRKLKGENDAEVKLQTTLDEAARARFGLDVGPALAGPMPFEAHRPYRPGRSRGRFNVEADLTNTKVENFLPGWVKAPGRQARLAFTLVRPKSGGLRLGESAGRRPGRSGQGRGRTRQRWRPAVGEPSRCRDLGWRQISCAPTAAPTVRFAW